MKRESIKILISALLLACSVFACNDGDSTTAEINASAIKDSVNNTTNQVSNENTSVQTGDAKLLSELIESLYGGIALMKQGRQKATTPAVKELAEELEKDHTVLTEELKALVAKKGWTLPAGESADDRQKREGMADDQVADYEEEWVSALKDRHETNIKKIENFKSTDADLQVLGARGLPKLRELLVNIEAVQTSLQSK